MLGSMMLFSELIFKVRLGCMRFYKFMIHNRLVDPKLVLIFLDICFSEPNCLNSLFLVFHERGENTYK